MWSRLSGKPVLPGAFHPLLGYLPAPALPVVHLQFSSSPPVPPTPWGLPQMLHLLPPTLGKWAYAWPWVAVPYPMPEETSEFALIVYGPRTWGNANSCHCGMFLFFSKTCSSPVNCWGPNCLPFVDKQTEKARFETGLCVMIIVIIMTTILLEWCCPLQSIKLDLFSPIDFLLHFSSPLR